MNEKADNIKIYMREDIQVISVLGAVTYDSVGDLKLVIQEHIKDSRGYIFELKEIQRIDSTGLGLLVTVAKHMIPNDNRMVIVNKDPNINELLSLSKLNQVFAVLGSIDEAIVNLNDSAIEGYTNTLRGY